MVAPASKFLGDLTSLKLELGLSTLAYQASAAAVITGGSLDAVVIGGKTAAAASFTTLATTGNAQLASASIYGGSINATSIGNVTPATGAFTTLSASSATLSSTLAVTGATTLSSTLSVTSAATFSSTITSASTVSVAVSGAQFIAPGYMHYSDGSNYYLLLTGSGAPTTSFNSLRPFLINLSSGLVSMGNGLNVSGGNTTIGGVLTVNGGSQNLAGSGNIYSIGLAANYTNLSDYSTAAGGMIFDVCRGTTSHGAYTWRSSSALTTRMTLDVNGNLTVPAGIYTSGSLNSATLNVTGASVLSGNLNVGGLLTASSNIGIGSQTTVGAAYINLYTSGSSTSNVLLYAYGGTAGNNQSGYFNIYAASIGLQGNVSATGSLTIAGTTTLGNNLSVTTGGIDVVGATSNSGQGNGNGLHLGFDGTNSTIYSVQSGVVWRNLLLEGANVTLTPAGGIITLAGATTLSSTLAVTGLATLSGASITGATGGNTSNLYMSGSLPRMTMQNTSAAANAGTWQLYTNTDGSLNLGAVNDGYSLQNILLTATRSGYALGTFSIYAATTVGSTLAVTGATTIGGTLTVTGSISGGTTASSGTSASFNAYDRTASNTGLAAFYRTNGTNCLYDNVGGNVITYTATAIGLNQPTTLSSTLTVTGAASFNAGGIQTQGGTATVAGNTAFYTTDGLRRGYIGYGIGANLVVSGDNGWGIYINSATTIGSTLAVTGATTLSSTLAVTGGLTASGTATFGGGIIVGVGQKILLAGADTNHSIYDYSAASGGDDTAFWNAYNATSRGWIFHDTSGTYGNVAISKGGLSLPGALTLTGTLSAQGSIVLSGSGSGTNGIFGGLWVSAPNAGIELGSVTTAGTPYIDFHTSGTGADYDSRIIASSSGLSVIATGVSFSGTTTLASDPILNGGVLSPQVKALMTTTGGGIISADGSGNFKWTARIIVMNAGCSALFSTSGYFDINMPVSGSVVTGYSGAGSYTMTSSGVIPIGIWQTLYYILPIGQNNGTYNTNFALVAYGSGSFNVPANWIPLATRSGDANIISVLGGRYMIAPGDSLDTTAFRTGISTSGNYSVGGSLYAASAITTGSQFQCGNTVITGNQIYSTSGPLYLNWNGSGGVNFGASGGAINVYNPAQSAFGKIYNDAGFHIAGDASVGTYISGPIVSIRTTVNSADQMNIGSGVINHYVPCFFGANINLSDTLNTSIASPSGGYITISGGSTSSDGQVVISGESGIQDIVCTGGLINMYSTTYFSDSAYFNGGLSSNSVNAGQVFLNAPIASGSTTWHLDSTNTTYTLTNGQTISLPAASGMILISNWSTGGIALYIVGGGGCIVVSTNSSSAFGTANGNSGSTNIYYSGNNSYIIQNNTGSTQTYGLCLIRTRNSA